MRKRDDEMDQSSLALMELRVEVKRQQQGLKEKQVSEYARYIKFLLAHFGQCFNNMPLKTSENQRFSDIFRGYRNGTLTRNGSNISMFGAYFEIVLIEECFHE